MIQDIIFTSESKYMYQGYFGSEVRVRENDWRAPTVQPTSLVESLFIVNLTRKSRQQTTTKWEQSRDAAAIKSPVLCITRASMYS